MEITQEKIVNALNIAYKEAGDNAYFGNGFAAGVDFVLSEIKKHDVKADVMERLTPAHGTKEALNYRCPNCQAYSRHSPEASTLLSVTKSVFTGDLKQFDCEPGYVWIELHKCKCGFVYYMKNGS